MKFDDLNKKMRMFETVHDRCVPGFFYMVARIDGRSFTKLTKETLKLEAPFDTEFRDAMVTTTKHLMDSAGFEILYGYTQSDEISLLFSLNENSFGRKIRKLNSVLAGEASGMFSTIMCSPVAFDCRISELQSLNVIDYFRWRAEDAKRNAVNAHCYWLLRKSGMNKSTATTALNGATQTDKALVLYGLPIPKWQKQGIGLFWKTFEKVGRNPLTGETKTATQRK